LQKQLRKGLKIQGSRKSSLSLMLGQQAPTRLKS